MVEHKTTNLKSNEALAEDSQNGLDSFLYSRPPSQQSFASDQLVSLYRKDTAYTSCHKRQREREVHARLFLDRIHRLSPKNPELPTATHVARGFGLVRTPGDAAQGKLIDMWKHSQWKSKILEAYVEHLTYMEALTHPSVLEARIQMLTQGIAGRVQKHSEIFERKLVHRKANAWIEFGWGIPERNVSEADLENSVLDESTTKIKAQGMWSFIAPSQTKPLVAMPVVGPSHPDLNSSFAAAEQAMAGILAWAPVDALFGRSDGGLRAQKEFVRTTFELIENHPLILLHKYGGQEIRDENGQAQTIVQHLVSEAKKRVGVTLKPFPVEESLNRALQLYDCGVRNFRIFDPRDTRAQLTLIRKMTDAFANKKYDDAFIFAGQVTGVSTAKAAYELGAQVVIKNIGEGDFCKTSSGTGMIPANLLQFYRIQSQVDPQLGIILDGGLGQKWLMAISLGATGTMKHGSLIGCTIHHAPCLSAIEDESTKELVLLQSGEAAERTKYRGSQLDVAGRPKNVEGVDRKFPIFEEDNLLSLGARFDRNFLAPAAKQLAFCNANSILEFMLWEEPVVWQASDQAIMMAAPHI